MEQLAINEHLVKLYLLGELPDSEREWLEISLLTDDRFYETLTALEDEVEDELIDQYLDGELTASERQKFEQVFLNAPERAHKLKLIKDLKDHAEVAAPRKAAKSDRTQRQWVPAFAIFQNPLFGLSSAVALTLALLCCVWLWMRANSLETQLKQAQVQSPTDAALKEQLAQANRRNEELTAQLQRSEAQRQGLEQDLATLKGQDVPKPAPTDGNPPPDRNTVYASVSLFPGVRSGSGDENARTLNLRSGYDRARIVLNVERVDPRDYKRFRAVLKRQAGAEVWRDDNVKLQPRGNNARAILDVPAERLPEGEYVGELDGITSDDQSEPVGLYVFRVVHK